MSRFDYVKYDEVANKKQAVFKDLVTHLERVIVTNLKPGRNSSLALTKLEECYMWIGKEIRDEMIDRNKVELVETESQEERSNS